MLKSILVAVGVLTFSTAAFAQTAATPKTAAECETMWKTADANADGKLDASEMEANKAMMPSMQQSGATGSTGSTTGSTTDSTSGSTTGSTTGSNSGSSTTTNQSNSGSATMEPMTKDAFTTACTKG